MGNTAMLFILIVCVLIAVCLLSNSVSNARSSERYGNGKHTIVINYARGEPTVYSSYDEGELHEWRTHTITERNVRSVDIMYANGGLEHYTK